MKKIKFCVSLSLVGCKREEIIKVDKDITEDELDELLNDWILNHVDCWHEEITD